jgi:alpha-beta hydrolase superfamily lysophospholipase
VVGAKLSPADAVLQLAAHVSRAITLTEWLDASIVDEMDPTRRDVELNLYDPANPNQPPYAPDFLARYRAAQIARSAKIDDWVHRELELTRRRGEVERAFVVHGTMADPRWLDLSIDANDRRGPNWCYMGEPQAVNMMPAGLARYSSLRGWLSQWSFRESRADGPRCAGRISVPVLVIENSADDACTPSHAQRIFDGVKHANKEKHTIKGATHYYLGQPEKMREAVALCMDWLQRQGLIRVA